MYSFFGCTLGQSICTVKKLIIATFSLKVKLKYGFLHTYSRWIYFPNLFFKKSIKKLLSLMGKENIVIQTDDSMNVIIQPYDNIECYHPGRW
jgi:hypothetical protein